MLLTAHQRAVKDEFIRVRGAWNDVWNPLLELSPEFLLQYLTFSAVPARKGHLDPITRELVYIALDSSATHLYEQGIRQHCRAALNLGATPAQVLTVIQLSSLVGYQSMEVGAPALAAVLAGTDAPVTGELTEQQQALKRRFVELHGQWTPASQHILELDPEMFEAHLGLSTVPRQAGALEPAVQELIGVALDVAVTNRYRPGLTSHIENALRCGATPGQVLEVMELASAIGIHAAAVAVPILMDELSAREAGGA
ncbi:MAG TPA: carboxymuconolactone decarboxylase family protein [Homoserinimonas sp.]|nr:carboxymuconolactone decarboxylase family protein [Homoserinimonas sp.]